MLKEITLQAESDLIERARAKAERESSTLDAHFQRWLEHYVEATAYDRLMDELAQFKVGQQFSRDILNER